METTRYTIPLDSMLENVGSISMSNWRLYSGFGVSGHTQIERTVTLVDLALKAEQQGRVLRADFFWKEAHRTLRATWQQGSPWEKVAREAFWETHWAVVRGGLKDKDIKKIAPDARAFVHLEWIRQMMDLLPEDADSKIGDLEKALRIKADVQTREARFDDALKTVDEMRALGTDNARYVSRAADIQMEITSRALAAGGDNLKKRKNALLAGINAIARLRSVNRPNLTVLQSEAMLRQQLAVCYANSGQYSEAIVQSHMAQLLDHSVEDGKEIFEKIVALMDQLQQQAKIIREKLRTSGGQLTAEGSRIVKEADKGYKPFEAYVKSSEHQELGELYEKALADYIWREVEGKEPDPQDSRPKELLTTVREIFSREPDHPVALDYCCREALKQRPDLQQVSPVAVRGYLHRRLFPYDPDILTPSRMEPPSELGDGPSIDLPSKPSKPDGEPVQGWLYSRDDLAIKLQCVAAVVLIFVAAWFGSREYINRANRAEAYLQAHNAAAVSDPSKVMDAARHFFKSKLLGHDSRETEMAMLYDEAMIRWMVRENPTEEELLERLEDRKAVVASGRRQ